MIIDYSATSCGVRQLSGINHFREDTPNWDIFKGIQSVIGAKGSFVFITFSDVYRTAPDRGGVLLAKRIVETGIGEVGESVKTRNPNTGNTICVWVWKVSDSDFTKWMKAQGENVKKATKS